MTLDAWPEAVVVGCLGLLGFGGKKIIDHDARLSRLEECHTDMNRRLVRIEDKQDQTLKLVKRGKR